MSPINLATLNVDLTRIENAEVRRTIRQLVQQLQEVILQQQLQIEALVEMTVDKHVWSMSEYRRYIQKLQQNAAKSPDRPHTPAVQQVRDHPVAPQVQPTEVDADESGRHVYRL